MIFAGVLLLVLGCTNIIDGVAAVSGWTFFVGAHYMFGDLPAWGWAVWLVGIAQGLTACGCSAQAAGRTMARSGICVPQRAGSTVDDPGVSVWSLALFGLDILVIYGLVVYEGRSYRPV
jgi:hypothetical protein